MLFKLTPKVALITFCAFINFKSMLALNIKSEEVTYNSDGVTCKGMVAYDADLKGKRPAILVVPEWWGCNDYVRTRAKQLAELGYIAIAVDMYGEGKIADNPAKAQEYAMVYYKDAELAVKRLNAAIEKIKSYQETDANKIAAIGYCFGGSMVLNAAKMGVSFIGVVSFHGGLAGVPAKEGIVKSKILVCHGGADKFVSKEDIDGFKKNLDDFKVNYTFKVYDGATHAFSNPDATANGVKFNIPIAYNAEADKNSWADMKLFLTDMFK